MYRKSIRIILFTREKLKWCTWPGNVMKRYGIGEYDILLTGDTKIFADKIE